MTQEEIEKVMAEHPSYKVLFPVLDAIFAVPEFIRMIPWRLWYLLSMAYILTVYRAFWYIQSERQRRKWRRQ